MIFRATMSALLALIFPCTASAQPTLQLWGNLALTWPRSHRLSYQLEIEPKVLLVADEGAPHWATLDVVPNVEYAARRWADLVGEIQTGFTAQTDDLNSFELSPRLGVRLHLFSRDLPRIVNLRELPPKRRVVIRGLARVEFRNLFYNQDKDTNSTVRFRNRVEFLVPLNKNLVTDDGARYLLADWEWFIPLDDVAERFASKQRIRTGLGYRRSFHWRLEILYIWNRSRNTVDEGFTDSDHIIDVQFKRVF